MNGGVDLLTPSPETDWGWWRGRKGNFRWWARRLNCSKYEEDTSGTPHFNICYKTPAYSQLRNRIYAACDTIFADDRLTRKSQQGHLIFSNSGPIIWKSNRQRTIRLSTTEAELDSFVSCVRRQVLAQWGYWCLVMLVTKRDRWESTSQGRVMCEHY